MSSWNRRRGNRRRIPVRLGLAPSSVRYEVRPSPAVSASLTLSHLALWLLSRFPPDGFCSYACYVPIVYDSPQSPARAKDSANSLSSHRRTLPVRSSQIKLWRSQLAARAVVHIHTRTHTDIIPASEASTRPSCIVRRSPPTVNRRATGSVHRHTTVPRHWQTDGPAPRFHPRRMPPNLELRRPTEEPFEVVLASHVPIETKTREVGISAAVATTVECANVRLLHMSLSSCMAYFGAYGVRCT